MVVSHYMDLLVGSEDLTCESIPSCIEVDDNLAEHLQSL